MKMLQIKLDLRVCQACRRGDHSHSRVSLAYGAQVFTKELDGYSQKYAKRCNMPVKINPIIRLELWKGTTSLLRNVERSSVGAR